MPEQTRESKDQVVLPEYIAVKVVSRVLHEDDSLSAVRVQAVRDCDYALLPQECKVLDGVFQKGESDEVKSKPQEFYVQNNSLRKMHNYFMGEPSNLENAAETVVMNHRETTNCDGDFADMRVYYGHREVPDNVRRVQDRPRNSKKQKLLPDSGTCTQLIPECASLRKNTWDDNELVIFRHPENGKECLGFVGGSVKDPYFRHTKHEKKDEHIVVFVLHFLNDKGKDLSWSRSVVFEPRMAAESCLLKVSNDL
jgi:hypothetical protein